MVTDNLNMKIANIIILIFISFSVVAQKGTTKPHRSVGIGIWDNTPPSSYQPMNGIYHIDTTTNTFWIHKGDGIYEPLNTNDTQLDTFNILDSDSILIRVTSQGVELNRDTIRVLENDPTVPDFIKEITKDDITDFLENTQNTVSTSDPDVVITTTPNMNGTDNYDIAVNVSGNSTIVDNGNGTSTITTGDNNTLLIDNDGVDNVDDLDNDPTNEIQDLTPYQTIAGTSNWDKDNSDDFDGDYNNLTNKPTIPIDTDTQLTEADIIALGFIQSPNDADFDPTNELQDTTNIPNLLEFVQNHGDGFEPNTDTQLTEAEVDAFVSNNGYLTQDIDTIYNAIEGNAINISRNVTGTTVSNTFSVIESDIDFVDIDSVGFANYVKPFIPVDIDTNYWEYGANEDTTKNLSPIVEIKGTTFLNGRVLDADGDTALVNQVLGIDPITGRADWVDRMDIPLYVDNVVHVALDNTPSNDISVSGLGDSNSSSTDFAEVFLQMYDDNYSLGFIQKLAFGNDELVTTSGTGTVISDPNSWGWTAYSMDAGENITFTSNYNLDFYTYNSAELHISNEDVSTYTVEVLRNGVVQNTNNYTTDGNGGVNYISVAVGDSGLSEVSVTTNSGKLICYGMYAFNENEVTFNKLARSGQNTSGWLNTMQNTNWQDQQDHRSPEFFIISLGTNDIPLGRDQYKSNLSEMVDIVNSENTNVILVSPHVSSDIVATEWLDMATYEVAVEKEVSFFSINQFAKSYIGNIDNDGVHYVSDFKKSFQRKILDIFLPLIEEDQITSFLSKSRLFSTESGNFKVSDAIYDGVGNVGIKQLNPTADLHLSSGQVSDINIESTTVGKTYNISVGEGSIDQFIISNEDDAVIQSRNFITNHQLSLGKTTTANYDSQVLIENINAENILICRDDNDDDVLQITNSKNTVGFFGTRFQPNGLFEGGNEVSYQITSPSGFYDCVNTAGKLAIELPPLGNSSHVKLKVHLINDAIAADIGNTSEVIEVSFYNVTSQIYGEQAFFQDVNLGYTKTIEFRSTDTANTLLIGDFADNFDGYRVMVTELYANNQNFDRLFNNSFNISQVTANSFGALRGTVSYEDQIPLFPTVADGVASDLISGQKFRVDQGNGSSLIYSKN